MNRKDLMQELIKKYSFERALSIIQIATEDREFENNDLKIIMTRTLDGDLFDLEYKVKMYETRI